MEATGCVRLWGRGRRYVLTELLFDHGPLRVAEIVALLHAEGLVVGGRPSKTVSDALRWEVAHGRVVRLGRGLYGPGRLPRSTRAWIRRRNRLLRTQRVCPVGRPTTAQVGAPHDPPPHHNSPSDPPHGRSPLGRSPGGTAHDAPAGAAIEGRRTGRYGGPHRLDRADEVVVVGAGWCEAEEAAGDAIHRRRLLAELGWSGP